MSSLEYRPAIDGLRAIAVTSVLLFHLHPSLLRGGFVGVDVFFVISGYLISSIIYSEFDAGRFSFRRFYQRRIARIAPVFFLVTAAVLGGAFVIYTPQDLASAGAVAISAMLSVANMKFMLQGNYFEVSEDAQPFLHFWSLAVEEQFYILFPFFVFLTRWMRLPKRLFTALLVCLLVVSFGLCVYLTRSKPTWAFYLLPTRAWELLAGCILAANRDRDVGRESTPASKRWSNAGLIVVISSFFIITEGKHFPGCVAALPVVGTVMFIGRTANTKSVSEWLLSQSMVVFVGRISYSLYLWHWPVFCFVDYSMFAYSFAARTYLKLIFTIVLTVLTYLLFENPLRISLNNPLRQRFAFASFIVGVVTFSVLGSSIRNENYIDARVDRAKFGGRIFNASVVSPVVVLIGDSHGSMYGKLVKELAYEVNCRAHILSVSAGDPYPESQLFKDSMEFLDRTKPDVVIFVSEWYVKIGRDLERFEKAIAAIQPRCRSLILITQPPVLPEYATRQKFRELGTRPCFEEESVSGSRRKTNRFVCEHRSEQVRVIDIEPVFVKADGEIRIFNDQGRQTYHDRGHLSGFGSDLVKPLLAEEIRNAVAKQNATGMQVRSN